MAGKMSACATTSITAKRQFLKLLVLTTGGTAVVARQRDRQGVLEIGIATSKYNSEPRKENSFADIPRELGRTWNPTTAPERFDFLVQKLNLSPWIIPGILGP
ncbi:hypothetical protein B0H19DRAFT_1085772 [Mycena capillaripes]|nr:hypothetical protein B0H19DRAFT_1085772 [Mycena capillaripes]